jgi:CMP-N,N'-diacetyllegionaminic acid synthase
MNVPDMPRGVIATVCARGGSKGLPGKNLRSFAGKPLIEHTIAHALACADVDAVYVSTDDPQIAQVARAAGATVPYMRPAELATDEAGKLPVVEHLVAHLEQQGALIRRVVDLQPTSPLRESADIAMALAAHPQAQLVVSVSEAADNPYFNLVEAGQDGFVHLCKGDGTLRRQDAPPVYALNGSIYVWRREALSLAAKHGLFSVPAAPFVMPRWKSVDIDTLDDFEHAQWLFERHFRAAGAHRG